MYGLVRNDMVRLGMARDGVMVHGMSRYRKGRERSYSQRINIALVLGAQNDFTAECGGIICKQICACSRKLGQTLKLLRRGLGVG